MVEKQKIEYKAVMVKPETHRKFAIRAVKEAKTHDELLNNLLQHENSKKLPK